MGRRSMIRARDAELMDEDVVGLFLSTEPLRGVHSTASEDEPQLRRFIHDQENIEQPCVIGSGEHGVVVLASIKGKKYALKIVSNSSN